MRGKAIYLTREEMKLIELCLDNVEAIDFIENTLRDSGEEEKENYEKDYESYNAYHSVSEKISKALREGAE
ncbi:hypothetical protein C6370_20505 [Bacillus atrophaeus]|uniref:hypothetical protein n=1 Tax=Bacillus atrophaeus TaxID=1452 RepID=UPI000D05ED9A|nr:hypothetical protein [Bacillus atrophaeus]PSA89343.1 hypothetical protein C6370_20505 [Bacillus atrophaeus]